MNKNLIFIGAVILIFAGISMYFFMNKEPISPTPEIAEIKNFKECVPAGIRIVESYPRQCWTAEGQTFTEEGEPTPFEVLSAQKPVIDDISPSSGLMRDKITIQGSGFTMNDNDIAFTNSQLEFQGNSTAYLNHVYSPDGKTLSFYLPDELGACANSRMKENEACPAVAMFMPKGTIQISVVNKNGDSNSVTFTVQ